MIPHKINLKMGLGIALGLGLTALIFQQENIAKMLPSPHGYIGKCAEVITPYREEYTQLCPEMNTQSLERMYLDGIVTKANADLFKAGCPTGCEEWSCPRNKEDKFAPLYQPLFTCYNSLARKE